MRVWDAATGTRLAFQLGRGETRDAVYSPDGTRILTTDGSSESHEYYASVWDAGLEKELLRLSGHTAYLFRARYDPQGKQIATASEDGTARVWDAATGTQRLFLVQHDYWILEPIYSPDGKQLATQGESGHLEIWDAETGKKLAAFSGWGRGYSPDSKRIVMTRDDNTAWVWETTAWTKVLVLIGHTDAIWGATYSPDGTQILTRSRDRTARIWDAQSGQQLAVLDGHPGAVSIAIYSPDSRYVVTATYGDPARVWNARTGELVATLGSKGDGVDVAVFSPDGRQLFTGNEEGTAHVWDTATWRELVEWATRAAPVAALPPQATATAQAAQSLLQTSSNWPVVLSETFDRAANGWTVDSYDSSMGKASKDIAGGKYKWTLSANQPWVSRDIPGVGTASDFVVGVEGRRVSGPNTCGYGVSLRDDYHSLYLMVVNNDQAWRFGRAETYLPLSVLAQGSSPTIKRDEVNRVQVVARGKIYTLFVNNVFVGEVSDAALEGTSIGIGVEMVKAGDVCEFEFDNFEVRAP